MSCVAVDCPDPPEIANGEVLPISDEKYYFGDIPEYNCSSNYSLGTIDMKCGAGKTWEGNLTRCKCELFLSCFCFGICFSF